MLPALAREFRSSAVQHPRDLHVVALLPWFGASTGPATQTRSSMPPWEQLLINTRAGVRSLRDFSARIAREDQAEPTTTHKTFVYLLGPSFEVAKRSPPPPSREQVQLSGTVSPYLADAAIAGRAFAARIAPQPRKEQRSGLVTLPARRSAALSEEARSGYSLGVALALERIAQWPLEQMGGFVPRGYTHLPRPIQTVLLVQLEEGWRGDDPQVPA